MGIIVMRKYYDIRREYGASSLDEKSVHRNPLKQFQIWFDEILTIETQDPTAMVLATVDAEDQPDARILLLKEISRKGFVFYTTYSSTKGRQLQQNPAATILFYWPKSARQVRIRGTVEMLSRKKAVNYFKTRPYLSQISALASKQSSVIESREILEKQADELKMRYKKEKVPCPDDWGGYILVPTEIEFFQGRDFRLHDRILYERFDKRWKILRLSP